MTTLNPYDACRIFTAIKMHFTTDYDYFKYSGKINLSMDAFKMKKDRFFFAKLASKYKQEDWEDFVVANVMYNLRVWSRELLEGEAEDRWRNHQKNLQSLRYVFTEDVDKLINLKTTTLDEILQVRNGSDPSLLSLYYNRHITLETLVILNQILGFVPIWNKRITDTIIWPKTKSLLEKYVPFLRADIPKYKKLLKEKIKEHA